MKRVFLLFLLLFGGLSPVLGAASGVAELKLKKVGGAMVAYDLAYGSRQVGAGAAHADVAQTYDLFLPAPVGKIKAGAPVFLFIHGGAWSSGSKRDGRFLLAEMASRGFVCASMNYALCSPRKSGDATFVQMLQDIDLMVSHLPALFDRIGLKDVKKIAIGGASAGGHLSLAYAYDGSNPTVMNLGLKHAVPIGCVYSDCGPADLASPEFAAAGLECVKGPLPGWVGQFSVLAGGNRLDMDFAALVPRIKPFSPISLIDAKAPPTICLYGESGRVKTDKLMVADFKGGKAPYAELWRVLGATAPESIGTDGIVATQSFEALTNRLTACKVPYAAKLTKYSHCQALARDKKLRPWLYQEIRDYLTRP